MGSRPVLEHHQLSGKLCRRASQHSIRAKPFISSVLPISYDCMMERLCSCPFRTGLLLSRFAGPAFGQRRSSRPSTRQCCVPHLIRRAGIHDLPALVYLEASCARTWSEGQLRVRPGLAILYPVLLIVLKFLKFLKVVGLLGLSGSA